MIHTRHTEEVSIFVNVDLVLEF